MEGWKRPSLATSEKDNTTMVEDRKEMEKRGERYSVEIREREIQLTIEGKVENRIIVQRRPRCRLEADEKEKMKWTVRLTGIYILSCAICVSELCRVTVRRIRSGKSVIITRATLTEASSSLWVRHLLPPRSSILGSSFASARLSSVISVSHPILYLFLTLFHRWLRRRGCFLSFFVVFIVNTPQRVSWVWDKFLVSSTGRTRRVLVSSASLVCPAATENRFTAWNAKINNDSPCEPALAREEREASLMRLAKPVSSERPSAVNWLV